MKKIIYYIYAVLLILSILMIIIPGIGTGVVINEYDDYLDRGIIDGFAGETKICIINIIIEIIILVTNIVFTFNKKNNIKYKYLIFVALLVLISFCTIGSSHYSGGFAGVNVIERINLWNMSHYIFK